MVKKKKLSKLHQTSISNLFKKRDPVTTVMLLKPHQGLGADPCVAGDFSFFSFTAPLSFPTAKSCQLKDDTLATTDDP